MGPFIAVARESGGFSFKHGLDDLCVRVVGLVEAQVLHDVREEPLDLVLLAKGKRRVVSDGSVVVVQTFYSDAII